MSTVAGGHLSAIAGVICCAIWSGLAQAQNPIAQLAPNGELRAALIASNPVLVTRGTDGQLGGVSVELAHALAAWPGVHIRVRP